MAQPTLARVVSTLRVSARRKTDVPDSDRDLLTQFVKHRDEAAFRALVRRHGQTVLTACRQVLSDPADIDDAFQATFLVLLKKAKAMDAAAPLGGWLFAVAHRVAVRCRADNTRRRTREAEAARRQPVATELPDVSWREAAAVLHDELNALPDKYRLTLLLCSVQGLTRDEAAEQLGTTVGAVRGQLERGRTLLERRLTKRGIVLSAGLLAVLMGSSRAAGGPSAELIDRAMRVVSGHASAAVAAFARGAYPVTTLKQMILPVVLMFGLIGAGLGLGSSLPGVTADEKPAPKVEKPKADARPEPKKPEAKERTITGKVVDAGGKPVPAELHLIRIGGKPETLGKTKGDGTFRVTVPLLEPGAYLVAKADGYGIDFMMPATNTPAEVTFKLPKDHPIRGRVIDTQGKPVAGAVVTPLDLSAFADGTANGFLAAWKTRHPHSGVPGGSNNIGLNRATGFTLPDGRMLLAAKTDGDGKFEIGGVGAERVVNLFVRGAGVADTELYVVNREKFDPNPVNLAAADTADRMMPKGMGNFGDRRDCTARTRRSSPNRRR